MSVIAKVMQVPEVLVTLDQEVLHIQVLAVPPMMDQAVRVTPVLAVLPMTDPAVRVTPVLVETAGIAQQYVNDTALTQ